jgi:Lipase (class 3)
LPSTPQGFSARPFYPLPHIYGSRNWYSTNATVVDPGFGESLTAKQSWDTGAPPIAPPLARTVGSDDCIQNGERFISGLQIGNAGRLLAWPAACFAGGPLDDWGWAAGVYRCEVQAWWADRMNEWENNAPGAMVIELRKRFPGATITVWPGERLFPPVVTIVHAAYGVAMIQPTVNAEQALVEVIEGIAGPTDMGGMSTANVWYWQGLRALRLLGVAGLAGDRLPLLFVGHSYGGVAAACAAAIARLGQPIRLIRYLTFGAPRIGDERIKRLLGLPTRGCSLANTDDAITAIPPSLVDLLPAQEILALNLLAWAEWKTLPEVWSQAPSGKVFPNVDTILSTQELIDLFNHVVANGTFFGYPAHTIAEYVRRIRLRCPALPVPGAVDLGAIVGDGIAVGELRRPGVGRFGPHIPRTSSMGFGGVIKRGVGLKTILPPHADIGIGFFAGLEAFGKLGLRAPKIVAGKLGFGAPKIVAGKLGFGAKLAGSGLVALRGNLPLPGRVVLAARSVFFVGLGLSGSRQAVGRLGLAAHAVAKGRIGRSGEIIAPGRITWHSGLPRLTSIGLGYSVTTVGIGLHAPQVAAGRVVLEAPKVAGGRLGLVAGTAHFGGHVGWGGKLLFVGIGFDASRVAGIGSLGLRSDQIAAGTVGLGVIEVAAGRVGLAAGTDHFGGRVVWSGMTLAGAIALAGAPHNLTIGALGLGGAGMVASGAIGLAAGVAPAAVWTMYSGQIDGNNPPATFNLTGSDLGVAGTTGFDDSQYWAVAYQDIGTTNNTLAITFRWNGLDGFGGVCGFVRVDVATTSGVEASISYHFGSPQILLLDRAGGAGWSFHAFAYNNVNLTMTIGNYYTLTTADDGTTVTASLIDDVGLQSVSLVPTAASPLATEVMIGWQALVPSTSFTNVISAVTT